MERKYTPSPWYAVNFAGFIHIHNEPFYEATDLLDEDKCPEAKYNATLAETAPELLEALQELVASAHSISMEHQDARVKAINAIHKALGQTNKEAEP